MEKKIYFLQFALNQFNDFHIIDCSAVLTNYQNNFNSNLSNIVEIHSKFADCACTDMRNFTPDQIWEHVGAHTSYISHVATAVTHICEILGPWEN